MRTRTVWEQPSVLNPHANVLSTTDGMTMEFVYQLKAAVSTISFYILYKRQDSDKFILYSFSTSCSSSKNVLRNFELRCTELLVIEKPNVTFIIIVDFKLKYCEYYSFKLIYYLLQASCFNMTMAYCIKKNYNTLVNSS